MIIVLHLIAIALMCIGVSYDTTTAWVGVGLEVAVGIYCYGYLIRYS